MIIYPQQQLKTKRDYGKEEQFILINRQKEAIVNVHKEQLNYLMLLVSISFFKYLSKSNFN